LLIGFFCCPTPTFFLLPLTSPADFFLAPHRFWAFPDDPLGPSYSPDGVSLSTGPYFGWRLSIPTPTARYDPVFSSCPPPVPLFNCVPASSACPPYSLLGSFYFFGHWHRACPTLDFLPPHSTTTPTPPKGGTPKRTLELCSYFFLLDDVSWTSSPLSHSLLVLSCQISDFFFFMNIKSVFLFFLLLLFSPFLDFKVPPSPCGRCSTGDPPPHKDGPPESVCSSLQFLFPLVLYLLTIPS